MFNSSTMIEKGKLLSGFELAELKKRINYTPDKLRKIQTEKIQKIRLNRANMLFKTGGNSQRDDPDDDAPYDSSYQYPVLD